MMVSHGVCFKFNVQKYNILRTKRSIGCALRMDFAQIIGCGSLVLSFCVLLHAKDKSARYFITY